MLQAIILYSMLFTIGMMAGVLPVEKVRAMFARVSWVDAVIGVPAFAVIIVSIVTR